MLSRTAFSLCTGCEQDDGSLLHTLKGVRSPETRLAQHTQIISAYIKLT